MQGATWSGRRRRRWWWWWFVYLVSGFGVLRGDVDIPVFGCICIELGLFIFWGGLEGQLYRYR